MVKKIFSFYTINWKMPSGTIFSSVIELFLLFKICQIVIDFPKFQLIEQQKLRVRENFLEHK